MRMVLGHLDTRPVIDMNTVRLGGNPTALFDGSRLALKQKQKQKAKASKKLTRLSAYSGQTQTPLSSLLCESAELFNNCLYLGEGEGEGEGDLWEWFYFCATFSVIPHSL
jgi:hypothetical protein